MPLLFHIVLALGVVHAFLLIALLTRRISENPFGFLSLIVTLCAVTLIIIEEWVVSSGAWQRYPNILRISAWMPFLIGPGIWGFVKSLESPDLRLRYLIHFVPALFCPYIVSALLCAKRRRQNRCGYEYAFHSNFCVFVGSRKSRITLCLFHLR
jgi:hypothetical protein